MKTTESKKPRSLADRLLPAFCVFCALGAAITGTMLLLEHNTQNAPVVAQATASPSATNAASPFAGALPPTTTSPDVTAPDIASPGTASPEALDPNAPEAHRHGPPPSTDGMAPPQAALLMANWHYDVAHWNEAIKKYQETIALGVDNADVRTDLGNCYRFSAQPQKALEQYKIAQKQNPNHENSLFNQAGLFASELKQPTRGVAIWNQYLKRFPQGQNAANAKKLLARYNAVKR